MPPRFSKLRWSVYMSSSAWVGCWSLPEPALTMGTGRSVLDRVHAIFSARPPLEWRIMITSEKELKVRTESSCVSPFISLDVEVSRTSTVRIPRIWQAEWNERKVRVLGCEK